MLNYLQLDPWKQPSIKIQILSLSNAFAKVVCKMIAILSRPQFINTDIVYTSYWLYPTSIYQFLHIILICNQHCLSIADDNYDGVVYTDKPRINWTPQPLSNAMWQPVPIRVANESEQTTTENGYNMNYTTAQIMRKLCEKPMDYILWTLPRQYN